MAIQTSGGPTTLVNDGSLIGRIALGNAANTFINTGTWSSAGNSSFSFTGTTLTNSGTITVGSGIIGGTNLVINNTAGTLTNNGTINATTTIGGGTVGGSGIFNGTMTLNGGSFGGTGAINGDVTINGGLLGGSSTITGATTVNNGGTLGGSGTIVGNAAINNGGVLAPGNSIGTLNVTGNVNFAPGGIYQVEVSSASADKTVATGTATLTGATVRALMLGSGFTVGQTNTILTAAGGLGGTTFAGLDVNSGALRAHLAYDLTNVYFTIDSIALADALTGGTGNQRNVAAGIDNAMNAGASAGAFAPVMLLNRNALGNAINQLSGEAATGTPTVAFQSMNQFMSLLTNPYGGTPDGNLASASARGFAPERELPPDMALAYAATLPKKAPAGVAFDQRWSVWAQAYGGNNKANGDTTVAGSHDISARTYGTAVGADYRVGPNTTLGFAAGGAGTNWSLSDALGSGRSDVFQLGAYGVHRFGAAYVSAAAAYAWHRVTTDRTVTISGTDRLTASFNAHNFGGRVEGGYRYATPYAGVTPYAALQVQSVSLPGYAESAVSGSSQFALSYNAKTATDVRTELGAWFDKSFALRSGALTLRARAAWVHDSNTDRAVTAVFQTLPGASFTVNGASAVKNAALLSGGTEWRLASNLTLGAKLDTELANGSRSISGSGSVRYAW